MTPVLKVTIGLGIGIGILVAALLIMPLLQPAQGTTKPPPPPQPPPPAEGETRVIEVESYQWGWTPETITVKQGEKIRLVITSTAEMDQDFPFHGFVLGGYDISQTLPVGEPTVVEFVANKTGNFPFFCSIYCGTGHGEMIGALKVE